MADTTAIIKAVNDMHKSVNASFEKVYKEVNARFSSCDDRVTEIEKTMAIKKAQCEERKKITKAKRDYWIPRIRVINIAGILALFAIAWEKLVAIWRMVP